MKILVVGSSSFAAQDVVRRLAADGHDVVTFDRRPREPAAGAKRSIAGDALHLAQAVAGSGPFDVLINYLLLKGRSEEDNLRFCAALAETARQERVRRVIHVSSVIVADARYESVDETVPLESRSQARPPYSRLKILTERRLRELVVDRELVVLRPGFILGSGLTDPMPGIGRVLPGGRILGMGWRRTTIPMIARDLMDEAIARLCVLQLPARETVVHLTDRESPMRAEYLGHCCSGLGLGRAVMHFPRWFWWLGLAAASPLLALKTRRWQSLPRLFAHNLVARRFDAANSERLLGMSFHRPWRPLVTAAVEDQRQNYRIPAVQAKPVSAALPPVVLYVGLGRIVRDRHLPALRRIGFNGEVEWFDPQAAEPGASGLKLKRLASLADSRARHVVVAVPPFARLEVIRALPTGVRDVLFEKPFATSAEQYAEIRSTLAGRSVFVLHNYRFKANAQRLLQELHTTNPGRLLATRLHFDSPAVDHDSAAWMRDERRARTLLMDYGLHFVDLALLFAESPGAWTQIKWKPNARGQTAWLQVAGTFQNHECSLFLRQGARQRRCEIEYVFQNCTARLRFFPDTMHVTRGSHSFVDDLALAWRGAKATGGKVAEKLGIAAGDVSHQRVLELFLSDDTTRARGEVTLEALAPAYESLLSLADGVYREVT